MKKRMLKGVSLLAIAVLLITQAGATQILEAEEAVLAEPATELGVPYSEIPLELTPAMLDERNHVRRVRDEEVQENMAVFENADGTRTAYLFAEDIWYEDENGEKQDYGKELITSNETGIAYRTENGSGELKLPSTLTANTPVQYEQNGLKITMAPTLDRVVSVPLPAVEAETAIELPGQTWDGTIGEPANAGATESEATQPPIMENTVEEEDNTAMTTAQAPATGTGAPLQADAIAEAAEAALGGEASVTNTAEPAGQNDDTTAGTSGSAALQESSAAQESAAETESAALTETAEASAALEEALLEEMPVVSEPVYSRMADNTIVTVDASRNLLEQVGDQLLGARRASLQEAVSQESGRTEDLVSYSRAFVDAAVEYKCVPLLHGFKNEIVLNSAGRANTYSFITDFDGLTPRDSTGYAIPLEDENGEVVTYLALEELMDAAGNYSMENVIDIAQYENGQYLVTITLDEAFLADEDTVYPVTASASSTGWLYHTSMDDTHIMQSVPTTNYYGATVMYMGRWASYPARIMMQFVFTDALKNAISPHLITEAKLYLWDQSTDTTRRTVNVRIPRNIWTASTVTWNTAPSYYTGTWNGIPAPTSHTISGDPGWWAFPYMKDVVAAMLRNYIDTSLSQTIHEKRGIMIKLADETVGLKTLRSSNHSENRPNMSITYTPTSGGSVGAYGPYWSIGSSHADLENVNCWGYAMKKTVFLQPTRNYTGSVNVPINVIRDFVIEQTSAYRAIRQLSSINSSINNNAEWRIACRFNSQLSGIGTDGYSITNYHFVVQNSNGNWSHKNGRSPSQVLSASPETNASGCWTGLDPINYHALYFALS